MLQSLAGFDRLRRDGEIAKKPPSQAQGALLWKKIAGPIVTIVKIL